MSRPPPKRIAREILDAFQGLNARNYLKELTDGLYFLWADFGNGKARLSRYTVSTVPDATENEGALIYVSDEAGGATLAFSDGTNWRRVQDLAVIS